MLKGHFMFTMCVGLCDRLVGRDLALCKSHIHFSSLSYQFFNTHLPSKNLSFPFPVFFIYPETVSLWSSGYIGTCYVDQTKK